MCFLLQPEGTRAKHAFLNLPGVAGVRQVFDERFDNPKGPSSRN